MKIKIFRFQVSNPANYADEEDKRAIWYLQHKEKLCSAEKVEATLNRFLTELEESGRYEVVDIKANSYTGERHNNGRADWVEMQYTIMYREKEVKTDIERKADGNVKEKGRCILLKLHEAGGCGAQDEYATGWDEAITEAIRIVEEETGARIEEALG